MLVNVFKSSSQTTHSFPKVLRFSESIKGGFLKYKTPKNNKNSDKIHQIIEKINISKKVSFIWNLCNTRTAKLMTARLTELIELTSAHEACML